YLDAQEKQLRQGLTLEIDGQRVDLATISRQVAFANGAGGLPTMKLSFVFRGRLDGHAGDHKLSYADNNFPGRAGWKEIVVLGEGSTILGSTVPNADRSQELSNYSSDLLNSPPQQLAALVNFKTAAAASVPAKATAAAVTTIQHPAVPRENRRTAAPISAESNATRSNSVRPAKSTVSSCAAESFRPLPRSENQPRQNTPRSRFTDLISSQDRLSIWVLLSAALIAAGLGALHALEPGHGKTIVAAYLVGSRGTARHAVLLGFVVTAAHTAGVYLLGVVTLYASRYIVPEQLYPWLGAISGLTVTGLGLLIFLRHLTGETREHSHVAGQPHAHWFSSMLNKWAPRKPALIAGDESGKPISLGQLCALGITGGIVPCPAALVVLLSAFSLHRIRFGLFLITAFSLGLALVLVAVGLVMVYAKHVLSRVGSAGLLQRYLPLLSSAFMVILGI